MTTRSRIKTEQALPAGTVDARSFVRQSIGAGLRAARKYGKFTQAELAERMGKSLAMVRQAESGAARVSERYVKAVLEACGLPEDWSEPATRKRALRMA